jgi:hypothetical protein
VLDVYTEKGVEGLRDYKQGPSAIGEEVRQFVIKKYLEFEVTFAEKLTSIELTF